MNTRMNFARAAVALALVGGAVLPVAAQEGPFMVRVRAVNIDPANDNSGTLESLGGVAIDDKVIPEIDFTYFFTPNFSAELVLTYPQKHDVSLGGTKIGTLKHLPPSLLGQYRFTGMGSVVPYVGAGINYTRFSDVNLPAGIEIDKNSVGGVVQVGVDIPIGKNLSLNLDVKKVWIKTEVTAGGASLGDFKVDPVLAGIGIGWRF